MDRVVVARHIGEGKPLLGLFNGRDLKDMVTRQQIKLDYTLQVSKFNVS